MIYQLGQNELKFFHLTIKAYFINIKIHKNMNYTLKSGDYAKHKIIDCRQTEVEALEDNKFRFCDFDEWVNSSEVELIKETEGGFI
jgi:hypothetical protein